MTSPTGFLDALLAHAERVAWDKLPDSAKQAAIKFCADTIGVGLAACQLDDSKRQYQLARTWGTGDIAPLGSTPSLSAPQAAFVTAFQIHCQEFDPVHEGAVVHAMSAVMAASLADSGRTPHSGTEFLQAVVLGVDCAVNLGIASRAPMRFFRPATAGQMGATLALCKLNGADRQTTKNALGLSYSLLCGTMQAHIEGSPALAYTVGFAARNAVFAWDMANAGCQGPQDVIEGPYGFMQLFEREWDLQPSVDRLGVEWAISELAHKPYPTGRAAQAALRMLDEILLEESITAEQIQTVSVSVPPLIKRLIDRPYHDNITLSQARLCLPFILATRILRGPIDLTAYAADWIAEGDWQPTAARININLDDNPDPNALNPQRLSVTTHAGQVFEREAAVTWGSPESPLTAAEQRQKFSACLDFGNIVTGPGRAAQWALLCDLPAAADVAAAVATLQQRDLPACEANSTTA